MGSYHKMSKRRVTLEPAEQTGVASCDVIFQSDHHPTIIFIACYRFDRLSRIQSIWQLSDVVFPCLDHGMMWSPSISSSL